MGQTKYFGLSFFDFGDSLSTPTNVQKEINRFVVIDKQLYGLYSIFGNGVIDGWVVSDSGYDLENGIAVSISSGSGVIGYMACQTDLPSNVTNLPPNSVIDIYATLTGTTIFNRMISFISSSLPLSSNNYIKIGRVATGSNSVLYVDNTIRDLIGFEEIIEEQINSHKHRGTPSKIDLKEEVKNQLPGARLEGIDASKITSGNFNIDRIPLVDHNDLENNGLLTHASLDAFVRSLSQSNKELLGEINSTNLIKTIIFLKYLYSSVDDYFINELAIIPGISPDNYIDFDSSTAHINLIDHCISGYPAKNGLFTSVLWNDSFSFGNYYSVSKEYNEEGDILIENDTITLDRSSQSVETIADFSDDQIGFVPSVETLSNSQVARIITENQNKMVEMGGGTEFVYVYTRTFSTPKNWDGIYDELAIKIKTSEQIHSPLYMYVVNGQDTNGDDIKKPSSAWIVLAQDEYMSSLTEKTFDISVLSLNNVTKVVLWTEDDFTFKIDDIFVRRTNMVVPNGTIRYRYQTQANVVFHSIFYEAEMPEDTSLSVRVKTASSPDLLGRSAYSIALNSGDVFALSGTSVEIQITMESNSERTLSPTVNSIELRMLVDSDFTGFSINTEAEWEKGTLENISIIDGSSVNDSDIIISSPINVGGRYYSKNSSVSELNDSDIGVLGFSGTLMPISPNQAKRWSFSSSRGFNGVYSVYRKHAKTFIIADTYNNRVVEVGSDGSFIKGFGSTYTTDSNFYLVSAIYNSSIQTLTLVFTKSATIKDITKVALYIGSSKVSLTSSDTVVSGNRAGGKILNILLDDDTAVRLTGITDNLSVYFESGAFTEDIKESEGMKVQGNSIFSSLRGFTCFVGEFYYIENILHPIFANETQSGNWMIANSSIHYDDYSEEDEANITVPDIIEIDPDDPENTENKLISDDIKFSDFSLGAIYEYEEDRFVISGMTESDNGIEVSGDDLLEGYEGDPPSIIKFRAAAVDALKEYAGGVYVIDKSNNKTQIFYTSPDGLYPSDISMFSNGDFLVSESSFYDTSGRLVRLDAYGNVTWNYGMGTFNMISDAKVLNDDTIIISS